MQVIDQITDTLNDLREMIAENDELALNKYFKNAQDIHARWIEQRRAGDWEKFVGEKPPSTKERIGGLFGLRERKKKSQ